MDRNTSQTATEAMQMVALRKESVDRNMDPKPVAKEAEQSLSARRAWIEITGYRGKYGET